MTTLRATIRPSSLPTRDHALVALITGATKAAIHVDRRKQLNRAACRKRIRVPLALDR